MYRERKKCLGRGGRTWKDVCIEEGIGTENMKRRKSEELV